MSITNGYATEAEAEAQIFENGTTPTSAELAILDICVEAASRQIDEVCNRQFYQVSPAAARTYTPDSFALCTIDDIGDTTGLIVKTDQDGDGTYETTWASTDFQLEPANANIRNKVFTSIRTRGTRYFPILGGGPFLQAGSNVMWAPEFFQYYNPLGLGLRTVQVTALFGWKTVPTAIKQACIIQAGMLYKATAAPFGVAGATDLGQLRITSQLHPSARSLVEPYRRGAVLV